VSTAVTADAAAPKAPPRPFTGGELVILTIVLAMANLMEVLDISIANVSIPTIAGDLGVSANQGTWVITSYSVANAITVPITGWMARRFGQVRVFATAIALFTAASFLCGISSSLEMLIFFRLLQGAVAGFMVPLSQALLMNNFPPEKRGMALAVWVMTIVIAPIIGPILGGWITDNYHWSWIFLINIPMGIFACFAVWQMLSDRETPLRADPIDRVGILLLVIWVGCLQLLLDKGNELDWFNDTFIVGLGLTSAVTFVIFLVWELTDEHPVVDLALFKYRNFRWGVIVLALGFSGFFATTVLLPLLLQTQLNYTAGWAGFVLAPGGVLALLLSPVVGKNMNKVDPRKFATIAFILFATLSFWRSGFTTGADYYTLALPQLLQGAAVATFFAPLVTINLSGIDPARAANATGLQNFLRMMAGSFGTSIVVTAWDRRQALHRTQLVESVSNYSQNTLDYLRQLTDSGASLTQAYAQLEHTLSVQAYMLGANDVFYGLGWMFLVLVFLVWMTKPPFGGAAGAPPAAPTAKTGIVRG
jgi:MFS transporter, DHA2 family, multidrug resistance protein